MDDKDKLLLDTYMWGFNNELEGKQHMWNPNPLLMRAYNLGVTDAIAGDDVSSIDLQSDEEKLNRIKNQY